MNIKNIVKNIVICTMIFSIINCSKEHDDISLTVEQIEYNLEGTYIGTFTNESHNGTNERGGQSYTGKIVIKKQSTNMCTIIISCSEFGLYEIVEDVEISKSTDRIRIGNGFPDDLEDRPEYLSVSGSVDKQMKMLLLINRYVYGNPHVYGSDGYHFVDGERQEPIVIVDDNKADQDEKNNGDSGGGNNGGSNNGGGNESTRDAVLDQKLIGTSWRLKDIGGKDGSMGRNVNNGTVTFIDKDNVLYINFEKGSDWTAHGIWCSTYPNRLSCGGFGNSSYSGFLVHSAGLMTEVKSINSSEMILKDVTGDKDILYYYSKTTYTEGDYSGGNSGGGGGGGSSDDAPYITGFNYTATKNSITVKFMASERPTSASIKYGENSASKSASSTISAKQISATVTGLKAGTKYYFKCTVRNENGSSTSDEYPAMTNY